MLDQLHPHLSHLNIVLHCIQNLLRIGDSQNLEIHIPEVDRVEGVVLPCDDDCAFVDWRLTLKTTQSSERKMNLVVSKPTSSV